MNYIVLDLEWNQSRGKSKTNKEIPFEIIEIGAMKLDSQKRVIGEFHELIKPEVYLDINQIIKTIIHLNKEELEKGAPFAEATSRFLDWCGDEEYIFCTWGDRKSVYALEDGNMTVTKAQITILCHTPPPP